MHHSLYFINIVLYLTSFGGIQAPLDVEVEEEENFQDLELGLGSTSSHSPPPPPSSSTSTPRRRNLTTPIHSNPIAPRWRRIPPNQLPEPHHRMDALSWVALAYCLMALNALYAGDNVPGEFSLRVRIITIASMIALGCLLFANGIIPHFAPRTAFVIDRVGAALVLLSGVVATTHSESTITCLSLVFCLLFSYIVVSIRAYV
ncbi:unnamed protein product [Microthlaspi erraticum]|uniref:Uncharacterized protein n=1 Tax=Microthlaspi erraticum TaxID=1685480 RepID=A0A6D2L278_9BRAS|nr:unnamed protein product [Microthlaspi erraticum]